MSTRNWAAMAMSETPIVLRSHFSDAPIDPQHPALLGLTDIDASESKVFLNAVSVASRSYLLPDGRGSWAVLYQNGARRLTGTFAHHTLPVDSDIEPVMALGEMVTKTSRSTWSELESISPTVP